MGRYSMAPTTPHGSRGGATPKSKGKNKQQHFSFPQIETKEIISCVEELGTTNFTEEELLQCGKNVSSVRRLFENLLEVLMGVRKEEINQPVFDAHENLSYCQLHDVSIPEMAFWRHISSLMEVCGISDFTREDLYRPETKRLKRQLSAIVNFAKFREENMDFYDEHISVRDKQLARLASIDSENAALQTRFDQLKENNTSERQQVKELNEEVNAMGTKVHKLHTEQTVLKSDGETTKQQNNELREKLLSLQEEYAALITKQKKLQGQVVQSPERVRREMLESQRALESERRDGEASEQAALVATGAAKAVSEAIVKVKDAVNNADELLDVSSKCVEFGKAIKKLELVIANNGKQKDDLVQRISDEEHRCVRLTEKSKHMEQTSQSKAEQAARINEKLRNQLLEETRKKAGEVASFSEEDKKCEEIQATMEEEDTRHRRQMHDMMMAWKQLKDTAVAQLQSMEYQLMAGRDLPQYQGQMGGYDAYASTPMHGMTTPYRPEPSPFPSSAIYSLEA